MKAGTYLRTPAIRAKSAVAALARTDVRPRFEKNPTWRGDEAAYATKHRRISNKFGDPRLCEHCSSTTAKLYDWANISGTYQFERSDWKRLCRSCHMIFDRPIRNAARKLYEHDERQLTLKEWSEESGINFYTLFSRVRKYGFSISEALAGKRSITL